MEASEEFLVYHLSSLSNELRTLPPESSAETSQDQPWKTAAHSVWPTKRGFYPWEETILRLTCISVPETSPLAFQTRKTNGGLRKNILLLEPKHHLSPEVKERSQGHASLEL